MWYEILLKLPRLIFLLQWADDSKMGPDELYEIKLGKNVCQKQNRISVYQFKLSTTIC